MKNVLLTIEPSPLRADLIKKFESGGNVVVCEEDVSSIKHHRPDLIICYADQREHANEARRVTLGRVFLVMLTKEDCRPHAHRKSVRTLPFCQSSVTDLVDIVNAV
jgi:hypothetical protein